MHQGVLVFLQPLEDHFDGDPLRFVARAVPNKVDRGLNAAGERVRDGSLGVSSSGIAQAGFLFVDNSPARVAEDENGGGPMIFRLDRGCRCFSRLVGFGQVGHNHGIGASMLNDDGGFDQHVCIVLQRF